MGIKNLLTSAAAVVVLCAHADAQSVAGKWTVKYPMHVQNNNGQVTSDTGIAVLTVEVKGDSVFGTWQAQNTPVPSAPRAVVGTFKDGALHLQGAIVDAKIRRDGDEQTIQMVTYYEGKLSGDDITGTMYSQAVDGSIQSNPLPWSARRSL